MLILHEVHEVRGAREDAFEASVRDEWMPALAKGDDARLLYFTHHAHGSGVSYNVVTLTALDDAKAWGRLVERVDGGDLAELSVRLDDLRHDVTAKLLIPLPWSPLQQVDLASVSAAPARHPPTLFMEDTMWPFEGSLETYVERAGAHYAGEMQERDDEGSGIIRIQAGYRPAFGSHRRREVMLWQKVARLDALAALLTTELPERYKAPGTWMHEALQLRDRWQSKLLRTASWSPWS